MDIDKYLIFSIPNEVVINHIFSKFILSDIYNMLFICKLWNKKIPSSLLYIDANNLIDRNMPITQYCRFPNIIEIKSASYLYRDHIYKFTNLTKMVFAKNFVVGYTIKYKHLSSLTNLTYLDIRCGNSSIEPILPLLPNLKTLILEEHYGIKNDDISKHTNLTELDLTFNTQLTDKCLTPLIKLRKLQLSCTKGFTLKPLLNMKSLEFLYLQDNDVIEEELMQITTLKILVIGADSELQGYALRTLTNLIELEIEYGMNMSNKDLTMLTNLKHLYLENTRHDCHICTNKGDYNKGCKNEHFTISVLEYFPLISKKTKFSKCKYL